MNTEGGFQNGLIKLAQYLFPEWRGEKERLILCLNNRNNRISRPPPELICLYSFVPLDILNSDHMHYLLKFGFWKAHSTITVLAFLQRVCKPSGLHFVY